MIDMTDPDLFAAVRAALEAHTDTMAPVLFEFRRRLTLWRKEGLKYQVIADRLGLTSMGILHHWAIRAGLDLRGGRSFAVRRVRTHGARRGAK